MWLELGPDGTMLARVVVDNGTACPVIKVDGKRVPTTLRSPVPAQFKPLCEATLLPGVRRIEHGAKHWRLAGDPNKILVLGDTGCRIKQGALQSCDDPELWPFAKVAKEAADRRPDLFIHVGDYLYRESICPSAVQNCTGPSGDNWDAWKADFFAPAEAALGVAPWIFARGNHESCQRAHVGWFYYLDPRPWNPEGCADFSPPYVVQAGTISIGVLDTAATLEPPLPPFPGQLAKYAEELGALSGKVQWIVDHHPFWGFTVTPDLQAKAHVAGLTLSPAWQQSQPQGVSLVLSGHVHLFEFVAFADQRPNQLITGDSGTQLEIGLGPDRSLTKASSARVLAGEVNLSFGFTDLQRKGGQWSLTLRDAAGKANLACDLVGTTSAHCRSLRN